MNIVEKRLNTRTVKLAVGLRQVAPVRRSAFVWLGVEVPLLPVQVLGQLLDGHAVRSNIKEYFHRQRRPLRKEAECLSLRAYQPGSWRQTTTSVEVVRRTSFSYEMTIDAATGREALAISVSNRSLWYDREEPKPKERGKWWRFGRQATQ